MNFIFKQNAGAALLSRFSVGAVFVPPKNNETVNEINAGEKILKEGFISATMPHSVGIAANVMEAIEEFRASTTDQRAVIVANPDPSSWSDPSSNFKPS